MAVGAVRGRGIGQTARMSLPDPALVVLVGASASGKSTWAAQRYRAEEVVSSDALRAVVGSGPHDLDASTDAFAVLEAVVTARLGRGLTTVVDTLGFDADRRAAGSRRPGQPACRPWRSLLDTPDEVCRARNAERDRPIPARALAGQLTRRREVPAELAEEGWDLVERVALDRGPVAEAPPTPAAAASEGERTASTGVEVLLQVSRFPWGEDPMAWLRDMALAADEAGFAGLALMDHLIQIPQVGRAWDPIRSRGWRWGRSRGSAPACGSARSARRSASASRASRPRPRPPCRHSTAAASSSASARGGGSASTRPTRCRSCPRPSGWTTWSGLRVMRALWAPGTKAFSDGGVWLPETTCYPRPLAPIPVIVGGGGERRTLRIAAELGDACNLVTSDPEVLRHKISVLRAHCADVGRDPAEVAVTVLDLPVVGRDRDDVWARVERLRGRTAAAAFAARRHAGTVAEQRERHAGLAELGVSTVFLSTARPRRPATTCSTWRA